MLHGLLALAMGHAIWPVRFGFAPALSVTAWLVFTLYAIEASSTRACACERHGDLGSGCGAARAVLPGTAHPHPASPWLPLHWWLGIISYGLLAAAVLHAWLAQGAGPRSGRHAQVTPGLPCSRSSASPSGWSAPPSCC